MKTKLYLLLLASTFFSTNLQGEEKVYPYRLVFATYSLGERQHVEQIRRIAQIAAKHGFNGIMLNSSTLDRMDLQMPEYFHRLRVIKEICEQHGLEIIPASFSIGYGGSVLAHDKNLAAGFPVKDALFVVTQGRAQLVPDPPAKIVNGGFEEYENNRVTGFTYSGKPGEVISVDRETFKEGGTALRFENFAEYPEESGHLRQEVTVRPYRCYRVSCWVKSEGLDSARPFSSGRFRLEAIAGDGRRLQYFNPRVPSTSDWYRVAVGFNSWGYERVEISPRAVGGKSGRFWIDDLRLEEVGLVNLLRRPGTPLSVRSEKTGAIYEEGRDYAQVADPELSFTFDHDGATIQILPEGRIQEGERLRVDYYHGVSIKRGQVSICMSEPKLYQIWRTQARLIHEHLAPKTYLLDMDEIRAGGTCAACKKRGMTMGEILGDCINKQIKIIREVNPEAQIMIWSDMLDPNHNAHNRLGNNYYLVDGLFTGSWNLVPKDLIIGCWRSPSKCLPHFSGLGFRTFAVAYFDKENLDGSKAWLKALDKTQGACGIMYTTWLKKYELLGAFGDMVFRKD